MRQLAINVGTSEFTPMFKNVLRLILSVLTQRYGVTKANTKPWPWEKEEIAGFINLIIPGYSRVFQKENEAAALEVCIYPSQIFLDDGVDDLIKPLQQGLVVDTGIYVLDLTRYEGLQIYVI